MNNKSIFAKNLKYQMEAHGKSRRDVCAALGFSYYTFSDWVNGKKYPRMDKVEMLAKYFGILKSDLIEEKTDEQREMQKNNDALADIVVRLRTNNNFFDLVNTLNDLDDEKIDSVKQMLNALCK